jgi:hypothetical protein
VTQVTSERDLSNEANLALKAELERYRDVTGSTVEALEREKAVKAQLENQNKAQVMYSSLHALLTLHVSQTHSQGCILLYPCAGCCPDDKESGNWSASCSSLLCSTAAHVSKVEELAVAFGPQEAFLACFVGPDIVFILESDVFNLQALSQASDVSHEFCLHSESVPSLLICFTAVH